MIDRTIEELPIVQALQIRVSRTDRPKTCFGCPFGRRQPTTIFERTESTNFEEIVFS
jgi:hypothetical protein